MNGAARRGVALVELGLVGVFAVLAIVVNRGSSGGTGSRPPGVPRAFGDWSVASRFLLLLGLIVLVTQLAGAVARRLGQPPVAGEIVAGIVLGPSVLGAIGGHAWRWLFAKDALSIVDTTAQLGLVVFMCLLGAEIRLDLLRGRVRQTGLVALGSFAVPFLAALAMAPLLSAHRASAGTASFALFLGLAVAVTAMPVLARILTDRGLTQTLVGTLAMSAAAFGDLVAWTVLVLVLAVAGATGWAAGIVTAGLAVALVAVLVAVVRPAVAFLVRRHTAGRLPEPAFVALILLGALLSGVAAQVVGVHAAIGGILFGAVLPRGPAVRRATEHLRGLTTAALLPLFFVAIGLHTSIGSLGGSTTAWLGCLGVIAVATLAKVLGAAPAGYATGLSVPDSLRLGALMNCRGLTELIVAGIGYQYGLIDSYLLTVLVLMAVTTTVLTTPMLAAVQRLSIVDIQVPQSTVDGRLLRNILGRFVTGVAVVTTVAENRQPIGMTVNSFTAVSLDPPLVLFCAARRSRLHPYLTRTPTFAVNILRESQHDVSRRFASPGLERFGADRPELGERGAPILADALAVVECTTEQVVDGGDHDIVIGRVVSVYQAPGAAEDPLIFYRGGYRILHNDPADWATALA